MRRKANALIPALVCVVLVGLFVPLAVWSGGAAEGPAFEERYGDMSWSDIVEEARGQTLYFYGWGGSDAINRFLQEWVASRLQEDYEIDFEFVPVTDASVFVNAVAGEQAAGRDSDGSVDMMWINGENFRTMREADLLFGPFSDRLPHQQFVDSDSAVIANDFGYPVNGYESPWGSAQFVMTYDQARTPEPPTRIGALLEWIRANPGRFAYPAPPDFTGSAFVRHVFYHVAGGYERLLGPFDQDLFNEIASETWALLNELEPYLWREGETYPENKARLEDLFANSEVDFDMNYNPAGSANLVAQGRYPESTRTFVFDEGTIANTHYVAISYNSSSKAAAMVAADFLLGPEAQLEKQRAEVWGDLTVLDVSSLTDEFRTAFESLPRPPSVLSPQTLGEYRMPELQADWLQAIEAGWIENVLIQ